ncbi:MAG: ABC transporter ATP-binding protein/permease [Thermoanaerobaculum sp.]|nr:ABC transporter ATP-binding protein/permease [Thermoanaerobaculum sp.]
MQGKYGRIVRAYTKRPWLSAFGFSAAVASSLVSLLIPSFVRRAVDTLTAGGGAEAALSYAASIVGLAAASGVFLFAQRLLLVGISRHLEHELRTEVFTHLLRLPAGWFSSQRVGDLLTRLGSDVGAVRMAMGPALMYVASTSTVLLTAVTLMVRIDLPLTLASLSMAPLVALATQFFGSRIYRRWTLAQEELSRFTARLQEHLVGLRVLRAFSCEEFEVKTMGELNQAYFHAGRRLIKVQSLFYPLLQLLIGVGFVVVLGYGGLRVISNRLTLGQFVEFNLYLARLIWPMIAVGWVANLWQRGAASLARLEELLRQPTELAVLAAPSVGTGKPLEVEFRQVSFTYPNAPAPTLRQVSFRVAPGQRVVILGEVGSGKSTLLSLLPRLLPPDPGQVLVGGRDVRLWELQELRRHVVLVPQTAFLFSATLRENITMGEPQATEEEVWEVVRQAGLLTDVQRLPLGLDTVVGERGVTLSGGQRQRVALARALLLKPSVLLLDDCLSAVDRSTEARILQALPHTTTIVATHRLAVAKTADWVVVLERGRVVEQGPPEALATGGGKWSQLLALEEWEEQVVEETR